MALILCVILIGCAVGLQSVDEDKAMGRQVAYQVESTMGVYDDPHLTSYLNAIGRRLVGMHEDKRFTYTFSIIDQAESNAFAAPGGYVYVSRGILALTNNEDELANIVAHEVIHVSRRHTARKMAEARVPILLSLPGRVVGGVLSEQLGNLINASINLAGGAFIAKHGRKQEFESDRFGQLLAARSGYDPQALATALTNLENESRLKTDQERKAGFFDTHPMTPDRVARLTRDAQTIKWMPQPGVAGNAEAYLSRMDGLLIGPYPGHLVTYTDNSGREPMHIHFLWFAYRGLLYQYVGLGPERLRPTLRDAALSFRPLMDAEKSGIKEMRLRVVPAKDGETLSQLSVREHNALKMGYTAVLNGIDAGKPLREGQLVKIAVLKPYSGPTYNP